MKCVLIKDRDGEKFLTVSFFDLLGSLEAFSDNYFWSLYELDASVNPPGIPGYSDLLNKVDISTMGYSISFKEIKSLARGLNQVINLTLAASDQKFGFKPHSDLESWKNDYKIVVEIIDGDYWAIYSSNDDLIGFLAGKYDCTEVSTLS